MTAKERLAVRKKIGKRTRDILKKVADGTLVLKTPSPLPPVVEKVIEVDPAIIKRAKTFKPRQMVTIIKDQPDFPIACASYPEIGFRGMVVLSDKHTKYNVPPGKVAVRFSAKLMGYLDYAERPFCVYYVWAWAIK